MPVKRFLCSFNFPTDQAGIMTREMDTLQVVKTMVPVLEALAAQPALELAVILQILN